MTYKKSQELTGRIDGEENNLLRIHQIINYINLDEEEIYYHQVKKALFF